MFLYSKWLSLDLPTRIKIAEIFGIVKRGSTHVVDNRIQSDGYNVEEVEALLTPDALRKYMVSNEQDPQVLWDSFIARLEGREVEIPPGAPTETVKKSSVAMGTLPPEEAKQFKKEYKARMKKAKATSATKAPAKKKNVTTKRATKKK